MPWDAELEAFKTQIDLREYAASVGYKVDRNESYRTATVMRFEHDKIIVRRGADGHFLFYSFHSDRHGSIIDFVQSRKGLNLGEVRKELRLWTGASRPVGVFPRLEPVGKDFVRVRREFCKMEKARRHPYLEKERRLPGWIFEEFWLSIYADRRGNAVFPHYDVFPWLSGSDPCGYEIKNREFTGFSPGGSKGLWTTVLWPETSSIVFCESAIDALSYAALFQWPDTVYASTAGQLTPAQSELITALVSKLEPSATSWPFDGSVHVTAAMDSDEAGVELIYAVWTAAKRAGRKDLECSRHQPEGYKDWNDALVDKGSLEAYLGATPKPPGAA